MCSSTVQIIFCVKNVRYSVILWDFCLILCWWTTAGLILLCRTLWSSSPRDIVAAALLEGERVFNVHATRHREGCKAIQKGQAETRSLLLFLEIHRDVSVISPWPVTHSRKRVSKLLNPEMTHVKYHFVCSFNTALLSSPLWSLNRCSAS